MNEITLLLREMLEGQTPARCARLGGGRVTARGWEDPATDLQGWIILIMVISCGHLGGLGGLGWPLRAASPTSRCALVFFDVFTFPRPSFGTCFSLLNRSHSQCIILSPHMNGRR